MNTGYGSLPPTLFEHLVERYARKDTTQIDDQVCISAWVLTNGFDWQIQFKFYPSDSPKPVIRKLRMAFCKVLDETMTVWARSGFKPSRDCLLPLKPLSLKSPAVKLSSQGKSL